MGMWDIEPWDNDAAADLLADLFDETSLRLIWKSKLDNAICEDDLDEMRAMVWVFLQLGRVYVWPIDHLDDDLDLAIIAAEKLVRDPDLADIKGMREKLNVELQDLVSRRK